MFLPKKDLLYHSLHLKWSDSLPIKLRGEVALLTETGMRLASVNITFTRLGSSALFLYDNHGHFCAWFVLLFLFVWFSFSGRGGFVFFLSKPEVYYFYLRKTVLKTL